MGDSEALNTVLISAFCALMLVCAIYFVHAHLVPHIKGTKGRPEMTLPRWQATPNPHLTETLYSTPTPNYLDPRNSIAGSDLRSSRWSTNLQDLASLGTANSAAVPFSLKMHRRQFSLQDVPLTPNARIYSPSLCSHFRSITPKKLRTPEEELKRHILSIEEMREIPRAGRSGRVRTRQEERLRSRSEPLLAPRRGAVTRSHASLYGRETLFDSDIHLPATISGTTLQSERTMRSMTTEVSRDSIAYFAPIATWLYAS